MKAWIRDARLEDAEAIGRVHYLSWMETYPGFISDSFLRSRSVERSVNMFRSMGCKDVSVLFVDDEIVGFVSHSKAREENYESCGEIQGMYLLKKYQQQGYGAMMMRVAIDKCKRMGFSTIILWVLSTNQKAIDFYKKSGFVFDGCEKEEVIGDRVLEKRMKTNLK